MRPNGRVLIYGSVAAIVVAVAAFLLVTCLNENPLPDSIIHSRVAAWLASRAGVRYNIRSLRAGCFQSDCALQIQATGIDAEIGPTEPLSFHLDELQWGIGKPLVVRNFAVRSGTTQTIATVERIDSTLPQGSADLTNLKIAPRNDGTFLAQVGSIHVTDAGRDVSVRSTQLPIDSNVSLSIDEVKPGTWSLEDPNHWFRMDRVDARGVRVAVRDLPKPADLCSELPQLLLTGTGLGNPFRPLPAYAQDVIQRLRTDLLVGAMVLGGVIFGLKLLSVMWTPRWPVRLTLAAAAAALPFIVYSLMNAAVSPARQLLWGVGLVLAFGLILSVFVYRKAPKWYNRLEPMAADVFAV